MYSLSENLVFDLQCLVLVNMAGLTLPASQLHELIYPCVTDYRFVVSCLVSDYSPVLPGRCAREEEA